MIQAIMLVALGFMVATLVAVLLAPSLWSRALRLSKKRLEATLPLSLAEIDASRDEIRAAYAVRLRRLEIALAKAKQRVALQLVDNSRLQMQIATLGDAISATELKLEERQNAALVLEQTITRRMPELERDITTRRSELQVHSQELESLQNRLSRREEQLAGMQKTASATQEELDRLRQAMEKTGSDKSGRLLRRPSQWTLDDYRSEYDRLHLELSKMRQQLGQFQQKDALQTSLIKGELQKLAELVLTTRESHDTRPAPVDEARFARPVLGVEAKRERPAPYPGPFADQANAAGGPVSGLPPSNPSAANFANPSSRAATGVPQPATQIVDAIDTTPIAHVQQDREKTSDAPKLPRSRIAQGVTAKPTQDKDEKARDSAASGPVSVQDRSEFKNGPVSGPVSNATTMQYASAPAIEPERIPVTGAKKVFADAQQLQTISELALAQDKMRGQGGLQGAADEIAREAANGVVLDAAINREALVQNSGNGAAAQRNLLDRLREASQEVETIDK